MYASNYTFWRYKVYADIRGGFLGTGRKMTVTTAIFGVFAGYFLEKLQR